MGVSFVNYQIRSNDQAAVVAAAGQLVQGRAFISPPLNNWVTLYDEASETQDAHEIGRVGSDLSTLLGSVVFAFIVSDSTLLVYYLFDNGDLLDEFHSTPVPTSEHADADQRFRFAGRPEILLNYCVPGTSRSDLEIPLMRSEALVEGGFASTVYAEERLHPLVKLLRMDDQRTTMGFIDFDRRHAAVSDARHYQRIDGRKFRRPVARRVPPPIPRPQK
jgi:hypothetical protein